VADLDNELGFFVTKNSKELLPNEKALMVLQTIEVNKKKTTRRLTNDLTGLILFIKNHTNV
jgi:hypothetical protein